QSTAGFIILVDDNEGDVAIAKRCYNKANLNNRLLVMTGGEQFLHYMKLVEKGDSPMPSLVLLDINMSGISGFDVLSQLRTTERFRKAPYVVMYSHSDYEKDR